MRLNLPPWAPDLADLDTGVAMVASNVLPGANLYMPMRAHAALAGAGALPGMPLGYYVAQRTSDGEYIHFAAANDGSVDRIYYLSSGSWTDISKTGGYLDCDEKSGWQFRQFGNSILAVSGANNDVQIADITDLASGFDDVVGNGGTDPPRCKYIAIIGEFVVLAGLTDSPTGVHWSGISDCLEWRTGVAGCDLQEFPDGGYVTGITGTEYGLVYQERSIRQMVFSPGSPYAFVFQRISEKLGCASALSICEANGMHFWLADDGFWMESRGQITPIGAERINRTFFETIDLTSVPYVLGAADPVRQIVYFAYPSSSSSNPYVRDTVLVYNYQVDRWTTLDLAVTYLGPVVRPSISFDDEPWASMALEEIPYSPDASIFRGGRPMFGGFTTGLLLGAFDGATMEATIEVAYAQAGAPGRAILRKVAPLVDTSDAYVNVATKHVVSGEDRWRGERRPSAVTGWCNFDVSGRYHKLRMRIPDGTSWSKAMGFEIDIAPEGGV